MIAIPVLTLVPGELGGSETYLRELFRGFTRLEGDYRVLLPPVAPNAAEGLPAVVVREYMHARTPVQRLTAMSLARLRHRRLERYLSPADVVHFPLTIALPPTPRPTVITLHDLQHVDLPAMFSRAERAFRAAFWHPSIRSADRVIVISEFVRQRAISRLAVDPGRVRVVPLGLDHDRLRPGTASHESFVLYPARPWPHKNHKRLFEAFALLRRARPELTLVLTGGGDFGSVPAGVDVRGNVSSADLTALMQRASALVFPSLYEGFGLPPLEAMACGCPVACSNAGALPEVVGDAARLFDPRDPQAIADAVNDVLDDPAPWVERGLLRAEGFSWDATARATDAVYAELDK